LQRPFNLTVPVGYRPDQPLPLVVLLHGYSASADLQDRYLGISKLAIEKNFFVALPNGLKDANSNAYWNATDACCAFGKANDDVAYLTAVIRDVQARYAIDPKRIFLMGHSNGGFMSHRMACDRSELIAGIVALAGSTWADANKCTPTKPVAVLQVHGTVDAVIRYEGGSAVLTAPAFPSAEDSVRLWAAKNRCANTSLAPISGELDLVSTLFGNDTVRSQATGCPENGAAELWTIRGGDHVPVLTADFAARTFDWLMAHPKP
jgi:polyhydroxybutyrate depolymerase